jgi:hypothetical protein
LLPRSGLERSDFVLCIFDDGDPVQTALCIRQGSRRPSPA